MLSTLITTQPRQLIHMGLTIKPLQEEFIPQNLSSELIPTTFPTGIKLYNERLSYFDSPNDDMQFIQDSIQSKSVELNNRANIKLS